MWIKQKINNCLNNKTDNKNYQSTMKINLNEFRSKSQHKKQVNDIYLPSMDLNHNANFIFKKSLKLNNINKLEEKKMMKLENLNISADNNPQSSNVSYSSRKMTQKPSPLIMSNKKMSQQLDLSNSGEKQSPWKNKSAIYFTKRQRGLFEQKFFEIQEKKRILNDKMLQRKESFESFKRMKQFLREEQKQDLKSDLLFKQLEQKRQKQVLSMRRLFEKNLLHQQNLAKISMQRELKFQKKQEELSEARRKLFQTENHSEHLKFEESKAKRNHQNLLRTRLEFLKNGRGGSLGKGGCLTERLASKTMYGQGEKLGIVFQKN